MVYKASAGTFSMAARFAGRLTQLLGEPLDVVGAEWRDLREGRGALEELNSFGVDSEEPAKELAFGDDAGEPPGRNDPCWCGSGEKYKKCHLREDERA